MAMLCLADRCPHCHRREGGIAGIRGFGWRQRGHEERCAARMRIRALGREVSEPSPHQIAKREQPSFVSAEFKIGTYEAEGKKAVAVLSPKITKSSSSKYSDTTKPKYKFMVTNVSAVDAADFTIWSSTLRPAGTTEAGQAKFLLKSHPEGGFLIETGDGEFSECDSQMRQRCVWKFAEDHKGKLLRTIAVPPKLAQHYPTDNFVSAVVHKDVAANEPYSPPIDEVLAACCYSSATEAANHALPVDPIERKTRLVSLYSLESPLYHEMNNSLRDDDLHGMMYFASYIKELRDVFKTVQEDKIVTPFEGTVYRGITFPDPWTSIHDYEVGHVFVWSAFTSMTKDRDVAMGFGNITFEVRCSPPEGMYEDDIAEYAPASISQFSDFANEAEVLFPPNIQFKVAEVLIPDGVNGLRSPHVICNTVAFDTDEGLSRFQNFEGVLKHGSCPAKDLLDEGAQAPGDRVTEFRAGVEELYQAIGKDSSGKLGQKEVKVALKKIKGALIYAGLVSSEKGALEQYLKDTFVKLDTSGGGHLSLEEIFDCMESSFGGPEAFNAYFAELLSSQWADLRKTGHALVEAFRSDIFSELRADVIADVAVPQMKLGMYVAEGAAVAVLSHKHTKLNVSECRQEGKHEYVFMITNLFAGVSDDLMWKSTVKADGVDSDGRAKFILTSHPQGGFLVHSGDGEYSECDVDFKVRRAWKFADEANGLLLKTIAAPPKATQNFPSENFTAAIVHKDPAASEPYSPPTQVIVAACCGCVDALPEDPIERQTKLLKLYSAESPLYHEMNISLREDDLDGLKYFSSYMKELRDVFKTGQKHQIITPFEGTVYRGINFPNPDETMKTYKEGEVFAWPAFTSMTTDRDVAMRFGNVTFEILCYPPKGMYEDDVAEYAPAGISQFSDFPSEAEILFPPNVQFKVKEAQLPSDDNELRCPHVICETVAFDTDEGLAEFRDLKKLDA